MKKDKEWAKGQLEYYIKAVGKPFNDCTQGTINAYKNVENIINQLDESKKPVIPKFVADYIEKWKYEGLIMYEWFTFDHDDQDEDKVSKWLYNNDYETNKRRELMLIDAIRYGYEVKKEKLYHVVNKENYFMLRKYDGSVDILNVSPSMSRDEYGKDTRFMLTEKEIKDYDVRYWVFAEEITQ